LFIGLDIRFYIVPVACAPPLTITSALPSPLNTSTTTNYFASFVAKYPAFLTLLYLKFLLLSPFVAMDPSRISHLSTLLKNSINILCRPKFGLKYD
jgi:hypothetical protein